MLSEYFLLVRRIPGLSLSINDFWELDTWTTQKLLDMEMQIIEEEEKSYKETQGKTVYSEEHEGDSEEMKDIMGMMSE